MVDPCDDPEIAAEMRQVVGVRYICSDCDWEGDDGDNCPACGSSVIDLWHEFANDVQQECA